MHFMDILHVFKSFDINRSEPFTYKHRLCRINIPGSLQPFCPLRGAVV